MVGLPKEVPCFVRLPCKGSIQNKVQVLAYSKEIRNLSSGAQNSDILADDIYKNMTRLLSREDRPPKRWAQKTG